MKLRAGKHPGPPAAEEVLTHAAARIQEALDRASPEIRNRLSWISDELAQRADGLALGFVDTAGQVADRAGRSITHRLAATAEHLADELSRATVPVRVQGFAGAVTGNKKAVRDGQKALVRAARLASKELRRSRRGSKAAGNASLVACILAAAVVAAFILRRAFGHVPEPRPVDSAESSAGGLGSDNARPVGDSPAHPHRGEAWDGGGAGSTTPADDTEPEAPHPDGSR